MSLSPHFIDEKYKELVFHIKSSYPGKIAMIPWVSLTPITNTVCLVAMNKTCTSLGQK